MGNNFIFQYFVPEDSLYYRSEPFSEMFIILENIIKSGKDGFVLGDQNGRLGKLNFDNRCYKVNVDAVSNAQEKLLAYFNNQCSFYPLNHLDTGRIVFTGDYTYIKDNFISIIKHWKYLTINQFTVKYKDNFVLQQKQY